MTMVELTVALPKGRLLQPAVELLSAGGLDCRSVDEDSRRLVFWDEAGELRLITTRPSDVPTYVDHGAADIGLVGKDVLLEEPRDVYELLDLRFGLCRFVLAAPRERKNSGSYLSGLRVATKFPRITADYFHRKGIHAEIIKLNGAVELAPGVGLADMIVDIVSTGKTLADNNLVIVDEIFQTTARLIANRASYRLKAERIGQLMTALQGVLAEEGKTNAVLDG